MVGLVLVSHSARLADGPDAADALAALLAELGPAVEPVGDGATTREEP